MGGGDGVPGSAEEEEEEEEGRRREFVWQPVKVINRKFGNNSWNFTVIHSMFQSVNKRDCSKTQIRFFK